MIDSFSPSPDEYNGRWFRDVAQLKAFKAGARCSYTEKSVTRIYVVQLNLRAFTRGRSGKAAVNANNSATFDGSTHSRNRRQHGVRDAFYQ